MLREVIILRKEIYSFLRNPLYVTLWLFLFLFPIVSTISDFTGFLIKNDVLATYIELFSEKDVFFIIVIIIFNCLYVCDSYKVDFSKGGMLFFLNINCRFLLYVVVKAGFIFFLDVLLITSMLLSGISISISICMVILNLLGSIFISTTVSMIFFKWDIVVFFFSALLSFALMAFDNLIPAGILVQVLLGLLIPLFIGEKIHKSRVFRISLK